MDIGIYVIGRYWFHCFFCTGSTRVSRRHHRALLLILNSASNVGVRNWRSRKQPLLPSGITEKSPEFKRVFLSASALPCNLLRTVASFLAARSEDEFHDVDRTKAGVPRSYLHWRNDPKMYVRLVQVSGYARMDITHPAIFDAMCSTSSGSCQTSQYARDIQIEHGTPDKSAIRTWDYVDDWPLVTNLEVFYKGLNCISATTGR